MNLLKLILEENEQFKKDKINVINQEIKSIGFENAAVKYSIAPSATDKGNIGWVSSSSLSRNILNKIKNMNLGDVSEPIVIANSILFYKLPCLSKKTSVENVDIDLLKKGIIIRRKMNFFHCTQITIYQKLKIQYL